VLNSIHNKKRRTRFKKQTVQHEEEYQCMISLILSYE